jgi:hypothetical protein
MKLGKVAKGAAIGGALAGPAGLLTGGAIGASGDVPQLEAVDLDQGTKDLLNRKAAQASQSPEDLAGQFTSGIEQTGLDFSAGLPDVNPGLGMSTGDLDKAITGRARRKYVDNIAHTKTAMRQAAPKMQLAAGQGATQAAGSLAQNTLTQYSAKLKNAAARKQARAQVFGNIMGLGGTIVGAAIAGGPGAAMGSKVGSS